MAKIISTNIITFKRISHLACSEYKIYVKEYTANGEKEYLLDTIKNPKISLDILEKTTLKYNELQRWQLKDEVTGVNSSSVNVYVNRTKLETKRYTFNPKNKMLYIHLKLSKDSIIEVEYGLDVVTYSHKTENKCEYTVVPVFEKSHLIGTHNIL